MSNKAIHTIVSLVGLSMDSTTNTRSGSIETLCVPFVAPCDCENDQFVLRHSDTKQLYAKSIAQDRRIRDRTTREQLWLEFCSIASSETKGTQKVRAKPSHETVSTTTSARSLLPLFPNYKATTATISHGRVSVLSFRLEQCLRRCVDHVRDQGHVVDHRHNDDDEQVTRTKRRLPQRAL